MEALFRRLKMYFEEKKSWMMPLCVGGLFLGLLSITSCGKGFSEEKEQNPGDISQEEEEDSQYQVRFKPLNARVGSYSGWGSLSIIENQFWARVKLHGPQTDQMHAQYLHTGERCPTMRDDLNGDGYLDFREAQKVVGDILIPLDGNITTQMKGLFEFPKMNNNNMYYYSEASSYTFMVDDLRREDSFPTDFITKLADGEEVNLGGRVVLIYGVSSGRSLPNTVASFETYPAQATLPVSCGVVFGGTPAEFGKK